MKALLNDTVIAEAAKEELIPIEGNWYFPPSSVRTELLTPTDTAYHCPWKGDTQYFTVRDAVGPDADAVATDAAWSYPKPIRASFHVVGRDYSNYVAFWKGVRVVE